MIYFCLSVSLRLPGCEDIIVESLSLDSLVPILKWSSQPYGSKWVHRQAMHFLCEEFSQVVTSDVLYELGKEHLLSAIQSDYLQVRKRLSTYSTSQCGGGKKSGVWESVIVAWLVRTDNLVKILYTNTQSLPQSHTVHMCWRYSHAHAESPEFPELKNNSLERNAFKHRT